MENRYYYKCDSCGYFQSSIAEFIECQACGEWTINNRLKYYLQSTVLKLPTIGAAAAHIYTYQAGKRQRIERISMQEVSELSKAGRLQMFTGSEVAALNDPQLFAGLENNSYYLIQPLMI